MTSSSTTFSIRPSTVEDDVGIRKVQVATWKSTYRGMIPDEILDQMTVENPPKRSKQPDPKLVASRRAFVAVNGNEEIIGFSAGGASRTNDHDFLSELWAIYVLQSHQGQGIGKALFEAIRNALSTSHAKMIIWVLQENHSAHRFYERLGGERLPLRKPFMRDGKAVAQEIAFGWELRKA
jgi:ribosomal protein S18 acetylase RimI-like enzyme